jgi:starch synthase
MAAQKSQIKNIWMLSREYGTLAGAGGVKDVVSQLAEAFGLWPDCSVRVVLPCYGFINPEKLGFAPLADPHNPEKLLGAEIDMDHPGERRRENVTFFFKKEKGVSLYLIDADRFRAKMGVYTYTREEEKKAAWQKKSMGHHDYFAMNILLQKGALELMILLGSAPDIIHCHDGHTAILPALIREYGGYRSYFRSTRCLVTIHNAGIGYHQEVGDLSYAESISGLPAAVVDGHLLGGDFDPFLVAGSYALINTVSENYARELQETKDDELTGWLGHELASRGVVLEGVTNGIDPALFDPASDDSRDDFVFDPGNAKDDLPGKRRRKEYLLQQLAEGEINNDIVQTGSLETGMDGPLITFVGRLSEQKGVDIFIEALRSIMERERAFQVLILGNGDSVIEENLEGLARSAVAGGRVSFLRGYSSELARDIYAAGDFLVVPSRFEPCGLTDFIAQLYGNIPIVHHVGGLVKVKDGYSGIAYRGDLLAGLTGALERGLKLYSDKSAIRTMQLQAVREIKENYTWSIVMKRYAELYKKSLNGRRLRSAGNAIGEKL